MTTQLLSSKNPRRSWDWVYAVCIWGYQDPENTDWPRNLTRNTTDFTSKDSEILCPVVKQMWFLVPGTTLGFCSTQHHFPFPGNQKLEVHPAIRWSDSIFWTILGEPLNFWGKWMSTQSCFHPCREQRCGRQTPHVRWTQDRGSPRFIIIMRTSDPLYSAATIFTRQSFSWNTKLGVQIEKREYKTKGLRQEAERWRPVWVFLRLWSWNHPLIIFFIDI